jgi:hypothetical protein
MTVSLETQVRADGIIEMNKGMLKAILDTCTVHGNDPHTASMINAALVMTINDLDKAFPGTRLVVHEMLTREITR